MTVDLVLRLRADGELEFPWRGLLRSGAAARELLRERATASPATPPTACLLLPAERVLSSTVTVPAKSRRQLERALPFAVEERLASDLDGVHIVPVAPQPAAPTAVRVVDAAYLRDAVETLTSLGWQPISVQTDADRLQCRGDLALLFEANRVLARDRTGRSLAFERAALDLFLPRLCAAVRDGDTPLAVNAQVVATTPLAPLELSLLTTECGAEPTITPLGSVFDALGGQSAAAIELLTGPYAPRRRSDHDWRRWQPPAIAAAVLAMLVPAIDVARGYRLDRDAERLEQQANALYVQANPGAAPPRDLLRTLRLAGSTEGDTGALPAVGFRPLLTALADVTAKSPKFELQGVSYQSERDELAVQLFATSMVELDAFRTAFGARGVEAELTSAEQEQQRVRARLRVHAPREDS